MDEHPSIAGGSSYFANSNERSLLSGTSDQLTVQELSCAATSENTCVVTFSGDVQVRSSFQEVAGSVDEGWISYFLRVLIEVSDNQEQMIMRQALGQFWPKQQNWFTFTDAGINAAHINQSWSKKLPGRQFSYCEVNEQIQLNWDYWPYDYTSFLCGVTIYTFVLDPPLGPGGTNLEISVYPRRSSAGM